MRRPRTGSSGERTGCRRWSTPRRCTSSARQQAHPAGVEIRVIGTPAARPRRHTVGCRAVSDVAGHRRDRRLGPRHDRAVSIEQLQCGPPRPRVALERLRTSTRDGDGRHVVVDLGCEHLQATGHKVHRARLEEPDAAGRCPRRGTTDCPRASRASTLHLVGLPDTEQVVDLPRRSPNSRRAGGRPGCRSRSTRASR